MSRRNNFKDNLDAQLEERAPTLSAATPDPSPSPSPSSRPRPRPSHRAINYQVQEHHSSSSRQQQQQLEPPPEYPGVESSSNSHSTNHRQVVDMPDSENQDWGTSAALGCQRSTKIWICLSIVIVIIGVFVACIAASVHKVHEGKVGIYFHQGALMDELSYPGVHWMAPFTTEVREISIRPQTDTLSTISAITKDGIENRFREVQVISDVDVKSLIGLIRRYGMEFKEQLVFDRIREELRIFCANHTIDEVYNTMFLDMVGVVQSGVEKSIKRLGRNGITLLNLVIPKPEIPSDIAANYKQVKVQWTEQLVATQQQRTEAIKKETESLKAVADAERQKAVLEIEIEKQILQKKGDRDLSLLENEIVKKREESNADVANYKKSKEAEANTKLYTKEYIQLEMAKSMSTNTKFFFSGESSVLGSLLSKIMGESENR